MSRRLAEKTVYLAGGTSRSWRREVEGRWPECRCVDPFRDVDQGSIREFADGDLEELRGADIVIGYLDYPACYTGMALEFGFAHGLAIPIVYVHAAGDRVDSMMAAASAAVFTSLAPALDFCERRFR